MFCLLLPNIKRNKKYSPIEYSKNKVNPEAALIWGVSERTIPELKIIKLAKKRKRNITTCTNTQNTNKCDKVPQGHYWINLMGQFL